MKKVAIVLMLGSLAGCAHEPSHWAKTVVEKSKCGMNIAEVEKLAGRELKIMSGRTPRGTHVARKGLSAVWFDFQNGKLIAVQPAWTSAMAHDEDGLRKELCDAG